MKTSWESVTVDNSPMRLYLCQPEGTGAVPAIIVIQNQDGVGEFTQEMTRRVAEAGYVGLAPDLYHRNTPEINADHQKRAASRRDTGVINDVNAAVAFLRGCAAADVSKLGIVGFCMISSYVHVGQIERGSPRLVQNVVDRARRGSCSAANQRAFFSPIAGSCTNGRTAASSNRPARDCAASHGPHTEHHKAKHCCHYPRLSFAPFPLDVVTDRPLTTVGVCKTQLLVLMKGFLPPLISGR